MEYMIAKDIALLYQARNPYPLFAAEVWVAEKTSHV